MDKTIWLDEAVKMKVDENLTWNEITKRLRRHFPDTMNDVHVYDTIRGNVRRTDRYRQMQKSKKTSDEIQKSEEQKRSKLEYRSDGTVVSEKFITLQDGQDLTPEEVLKAHGMNPDEWKVVSYTNNFWNSQLKGGYLQISYQSKLVAKPFADIISFKRFDDYMANKTFKYDKPLTQKLNYDPDGEILEIDLPDLHAGLLAWRVDSGDDYDLHIAKDRFYKVFYDVVERCKHKKLKKIVFVTLGDLLHVDNDNQTTTKGTFQQLDTRLTKIFDSVSDMLIDGITILGDIAPVEVVYLSGNHDRTSGCFLMKSVSNAFRKDDNVVFDTDPLPQKFRLYGNVLLGWTHGDMPMKNMAGWLQQTARKEYGLSQFAEIHAGHFHSENTKEVAKDRTQTEDMGGVVIRYLPTICNASYWENQQGYRSAVKAMMAFVWNEETGLREMWQSNII